MTASKKFIVPNKIGLHARPAAKFVSTAISLKKNKILVENLSKKTSQINAKSFGSVLSILAQQNDEIIITIQGENAETAMNLFERLFETRFGEKE